MDKPGVILLWELIHNYFVMIVSAVLLFMSISLGFDQYRCVKSSEHLRGEITRLEKTANGETYPVASYQIKSGKMRKYRFDDASTAYSIGDKVPLMIGTTSGCSTHIDKGIWNFSLEIQQMFLGLVGGISALRLVPMRKKAWRER